MVNPDTYAALYGPGRPAAPARRERPVVAALAGVLWAATCMSVIWLASLFAIAVVWGAAAGAPVGNMVLWALIPVGGAAALTALAFAPAVRRLSVAGRMLLLGALACPVPTGLAVWTWFQTG
ncbi:hypothetical protein [Streptomyces sp. NPDC046685]|uniref:hypothetical protein n=1 Tax=Streptomyces sp. NPDC046685 TaxID=3157202 RepID=UPI003404B800